MRLFLHAFSVALLVAAIALAPVSTLLIIAATVILTYSVVTWRTRPILEAARALVHAHVFGNVVLPERELRVLDRAVLVGPEGKSRWGLSRIFARAVVP